MSVEVTGTLVPAGTSTFPVVDILNVGGGKYLAVATDAARLALLNISEGMQAYVIQTGVTWILKGNTHGDWEPYMSAGVTRQRFQLVSGRESTDLPSSTPLIIGGGLYEPVSVVPQLDPRTRTVFLTVLLETSDSGSAAYFDLYDFDTHDVVPGSELFTTSTTPDVLVANLTAALGASYTTRVIEGRLWLDNPQSGRMATSKGAWLDLIFS